jgi:hypothetical protein
MNIFAFESLQGEHRIEFVAAPLTTDNARDYAWRGVLTLDRN